MPNGSAFEEFKYEFLPLAEDLTVTMTAVVVETGGTEPINIIGTDQDWTVEVHWSVGGSLAHHLCGRWCLCLYLESIGPVPEVALPGACYRVDMDPGGDGEYSHTFEFEAGDVSAGECGTLYLSTLTLIALDSNGNPGHIAGYSKGPSLMFYESPVHD